ncbi:MAG TPA: HlyD family efflux transporter periplasmic adaptor subunit [Coleofasciculaceae cyanobacterium]
MQTKLNHADEAFLPQIQSDEFLPPLGRWTVLGGLVVIVMMGLALPLASIVKYKVTVKAQAAVRPVGELRLVQTAVEGIVTGVAVKENQLVQQGELIATIDGSRLETQKSQLHSSIQQAQLQIHQINAQINALNHQMQAETDRIDRAVASAAAQLAGRRREHQDRQVLVATEAEETAADLRAAEAGLNAAQAKRDRYQVVAASGALSKDQLEEAQFAAEQQAQAVEAAKAKLHRATAALNPTDAEIAIATEQIAQEQASGQVNLATLTKEQEALIQQRIELNKQLEQEIWELQQVKTDLNQTQIRATADGIITKLNLRNPGQTVSAGQEIAQIVPRNAPLQIKAAISPDDIDKVKMNQTAQMRVSACPYPDYGVLNGEVRQISEDTIKPDGTTPKPAFYEVTIEPNSRALSQNNHQCLLQSGMEGSVDIVTREETVLQFLLRKARLITDI